MPLNAENKRVARALDSLDEPIIRRCVDGQSLADDLDRLVVRRINFHGFSPEDLAQPCAWVNAHGMATRFFFGALLMLPSFGKLDGDILIQRASEGDVDGLSAAAYAQQRTVLLERQAG